MICHFCFSESTFKDNLFCKIVNIPRLFTKSFANQFPLPGAKLGIVERWVVEEKTTNIHWIFKCLHYRVSALIKYSNHHIFLRSYPISYDNLILYSLASYFVFPILHVHVLCSPSASQPDVT